MPYRYTAFGLTINSAISLPELSLSTQPANVVIRCGNVPTQLEGARTCIGPFQTTERAILLNLSAQCGARFFVQNGCEVVVDIDQADREEEQRQVILGYCLTALLFQRDHVVLHANVVSPNHTQFGNAFAICGAQGAGKSTLTAILLQRQYKLLADDLTAIEVSSPLCVLPGYPRVKLWQDALHYLGQSTTKLDRIHPDYDKFSVPIDDRFQTKKQILGTIYILSPAHVPKVTMTELQGSAKLLAVASQIRSYLPQQLPGGASWLFGKCIEIAEKCRVLRIERPLDQNTMAAIADLVEQNLASHRVVPSCSHSYTLH